MIIKLFLIHFLSLQFLTKGVLCTWPQEAELASWTSQINLAELRNTMGRMYITWATMGQILNEVSPAIFSQSPVAIRHIDSIGLASPHECIRSVLKSLSDGKVMIYILLNPFLSSHYYYHFLDFFIHHHSLCG